MVLGVRFAVGPPQSTGDTIVGLMWFCVQPKCLQSSNTNDMFMQEASCILTREVQALVDWMVV